ncbi:MAG: type III pantothenate kinase [Moraxellaceae bacterium]
MSLVYYFDMGNTRGKFWRERDGVVEARAYVPHEGDMSAVLMGLTDEFQSLPDAVLGASVLDDATLEAFSAACLAQWSLRPSFARSSASHAGVVNAYVMDPLRLGVDRWLALIALRERRQDICVVDCGTAITLDAMTANGVHLGGYILPGLSMMAGVLLSETRRVRFDSAAVEEGLTLGRSTGEAVKHGALAAVAALIEKVVAERGCTLVLTGGDAARVSAHLACRHELQPELLLHGLQRYFADTGIN